MTKFILGLGLLVAACGSSDDAPLQCAKSDRNGAYVAHFVERANGTCGPIADTVLRFDGDSTAIPAGCALDVPDVWSSDQCKLDRSITCPVTATGGTISVVASTHETESGGAKIAGIESITAYDAGGGFLCTSTYDLTATRQ